MFFFSTAVQFYTVKTFYCSLLVKEDKLYRILFTLIKSQILFFFLLKADFDGILNSDALWRGRTSWGDLDLCWLLTAVALSEGMKALHKQQIHVLYVWCPSDLTFSCSGSPGLNYCHLVDPFSNGRYTEIRSCQNSDSHRKRTTINVYWSFKMTMGNNFCIVSGLRFRKFPHILPQLT